MFLGPAKIFLSSEAMPRLAVSILRCGPIPMRRAPNANFYGAGFDGFYAVTHVTQG